MQGRLLWKTVTGCVLPLNFLSLTQYQMILIFERCVSGVRLQTTENTFKANRDSRRRCTPLMWTLHLRIIRHSPALMFVWGWPGNSRAPLRCFTLCDSGVFIYLNTKLYKRARELQYHYYYLLLFLKGSVYRSLMHMRQTALATVSLKLTCV